MDPVNGLLSCRKNGFFSDLSGRSCSDAATAALRGLRLPPQDWIASQNAPVPRPNSMRPFVKMSSVEAAFASIAGALIGRSLTSGKNRIFLVEAARALISVQVSKKLPLYG